MEAISLKKVGSINFSRKQYSHYFWYRGGPRSWIGYMLTRDPMHQQGWKALWEGALFLFCINDHGTSVGLSPGSYQHYHSIITTLSQQYMDQYSSDWNYRRQRGAVTLHLLQISSMFLPHGCYLLKIFFNVTEDTESDTEYATNVCC